MSKSLSKVDHLLSEIRSDPFLTTEELRNMWNDDYSHSPNGVFEEDLRDARKAHAKPISVIRNEGYSELIYAQYCSLLAHAVASNQLNHARNILKDMSEKYDVFKDDSSVGQKRNLIEELKKGQDG